MRSEIKAVIKRLEEIRDEVDLYLCNAENKGQEEKADQLSSAIDQINEAITSLEDID